MHDDDQKPVFPGSSEHIVSYVDSATNTDFDMTEYPGLVEYQALSGKSAQAPLNGDVIVKKAMDTLVFDASHRDRLFKIVESVLITFATHIFGMCNSFDNNDIQYEHWNRVVYSAQGLIFGLERVIAEPSKENLNPEMTALKYELDLWLWRGLRDRMPRPPKPSCHRGPLIRGYMVNILAEAVRRPKSGLSLLYSLQKGSKQGWPSVSDDFVRASLRKHRDALSRPKESIDPMMVSSLEDACSLVFKRRRSFGRYQLSESASYEHPSTVRGATFSLGYGNVVLGELENIFRTERVKISGVETEFRMGVVPRILALMGTTRKAEYENVLEQALREVDSDFFRVLLGKVGQVGDLRPVAIKEPAKVRIVTCGREAIYASVQPFQGWLLDQWKACPHGTMHEEDDDLSSRVTFQRTQVFSALSSLPHLAGSASSIVTVSGDYSSATDLVKRACTDVILRYALREATYQGLDPRVVEVASHSFDDGEISYSKLMTKEERMMRKRLDDVEDKFPPLSDKARADTEAALEASRRKNGSIVRSTEGQPMGHPLSFPILCVTNLGVIKLALDLWVCRESDLIIAAEKSQLSRVILATVIINGDDIMFTCPESLVPFFKEAASLAGFRLSQGKNYVSSVGCLINSQLFYFSGGSATATRIGYLNQNLFEGKAKAGPPQNQHGKSEDGSTEEETVMLDPGAVAGPINKTCSLYPSARIFIPRMVRRCLFHLAGQRVVPKHHPVSQINWFLGVHQGGLGIDPSFGRLLNGPYPGSQPVLPISLHQRKVAALVHSGESWYHQLKRSDFDRSHPEIVADLPPTSGVPELERVTRILRSLRSPLVLRGQNPLGEDRRGANFTLLANKLERAVGTYLYPGTKKGRFVLTRFPKGEGHRLKPMSIHSMMLERSFSWRPEELSEEDDYVSKLPEMELISADWGWRMRLVV